MKLSIDYARCQGHGQCESVAPALFQLGPDDRSHLRLGTDADVPDQQMSAADDAIAMCPEAAIAWQPSAQG